MEFPFCNDIVNQNIRQQSFTNLPANYQFMERQEAPLDVARKVNTTNTPNVNTSNMLNDHTTNMPNGLTAYSLIRGKKRGRPSDW
jgi:hypothetical protein